LAEQHTNIADMSWMKIMDYPLISLITIEDMGKQSTEMSGGNVDIES
jgi:hypothetical protein